MREEPDGTAHPASGTGLGSDQDPLVLAYIYYEAGALVEARDLARASADHLSGTDRVRALLIYGNTLLLLGSSSEARAILGDIPEVLEPGLQTELDLLTAKVLRQEGRYEECRRRFAPVVAEGCRTASRLRLMMVVADCHRRVNDLSAARSVCEDVLVGAKRLEWTEGLADGLMLLALLDRMAGHWTRGEQILARALSLYRESGCLVKSVHAMVNLGVQQLFLGRLHFAAETLRDSLRRYAELGTTSFEGPARTALGACQVRSGRMDDARRELTRALRVTHRHHDARNTALAMEYIGELHLAGGRPHRARLALNRARRIAERIAPQGDIIPEVLRRLAEVELAEANLDEAIRTAREAGDRAERGGDRYELATALRVEGQALHAVARRDGSPARSAAEEPLRRAVSILEGLGEVFEQARVRQALRSIDAELEDREGSPKLGAFLGPSDSSQTAGDALPRTTEASSHKDRSTRDRAADEVWERLGFVTRCAEVRRQLDHAASLARSGDAVLILGETGTGKDLVARGIHALGDRSGRFIPFNCAACPVELTESELFGTERGAFTGADRRRSGLAIDAENGTLFLDEIGDLPMRAQGAVLRFADTGEVRALGSTAVRKVRVSLIAATHRPLQERVADGSFRRDLYFRIAQGIIQLPPLRSRIEDFEALVPALWCRLTAAADLPQWLLKSDALSLLRSHPWTGNVRELEHVLRRIRASQPPSDDRHAGIDLLRRALLEGMSWSPDGTLLDGETVTETLRALRGNRTLAAERLGISRSTLYRLLRDRTGRGRSDSSRS